MCALALEPRPASRPSTRAITIVDSGGSVFQRLRQGVSTDLGAALALVSARRALDWDADLRIIVMGRLRDWDEVARLSDPGPTLVVGAEVTTEDAFAAIQAGARGCLDLTVGDPALTAAIRGIFAGEVAFSRLALGTWLRQQSRFGSRANDARLTPRQREIVALIARGASDKEIGGSLGIATATAQKHVSNLLARLDAPNRAAAVALTIGLLDGHPGGVPSPQALAVSGRGELP